MTKQRKRRVFGKRRVKIMTSTYILSMRKNELSCHELWSRREYTVPLTDVVDYLIGQKHLQFA